ncbi:hypothetical protein KP509_27G036000 [Ceratopteris richardii]|uniref:Uncharacterized protein n=1 Tax=Ceratopteris richardii TaxID=49495 RepID=A0A8T2RH83_CERRI|nr:hypothetical protein KP509_27G036000 [Ceratopteris richardii]
MEQAPHISIISKEMVMAAGATATMPTEGFFLSCLDIMWELTRYNERLLFYRNAIDIASIDGNEERQQGSGTGSEMPGCAGSVIKKLKSSLAFCLTEYYPWCGRIARGNDPSSRLYIDLCHAGVEFVEAYVDAPLSEFSGERFRMKPFFEQLCQHYDHSGDCFYSSPLLSVQATVFSDGGLALGITHSHLVADGQSLWNFLVSWGEYSRGVPLSTPPLHNRKRLAVPEPSPEKAIWSLKLEIKEEDLAEARISSSVDGGAEDATTDEDKGGNWSAKSDDKNDEPTDASCGSMNPNTPSRNSTLRANELQGASSSPSGRNNIDLNSDALVQCLFHLPSSAVQRLKADAGGEGYTSFEVICAHFWQRVAVARRNPMSDPTYFYLPVNCRSRVVPPIPASYFGNVVVFDVIMSTVGAICREPLGKTARRIHDAVTNMKQENYLVSFMHWMETHNNSMRGAISRPRPLGKGHNVASSPWFPAYQVDFGWGKPSAVRAVKVHGDGELVLFGGRPGSAKGDIEICTALPGEVLTRLLKDSAFLAEAI